MENEMYFEQNDNGDYVTCTQCGIQFESLTPHYRTNTRRFCDECLRKKRNLRTKAHRQRKKQSSE